MSYCRVPEKCAEHSKGRGLHARSQAGYSKAYQSSTGDQVVRFQNLEIHFGGAIKTAAGIRKLVGPSLS